MKRKFTFLLMALLALAGLQGWAQQRGYTYEKLTGAPDPNAEYVLGYQDNLGNYYFHSSGEAANTLTLTSPEVAEPKIYTIEEYSGLYHTARYASNKYLCVNLKEVSISGMSSMPWDPSPYLNLSSGHIQSAVSQDYDLYHDGNIIKSMMGASNYVYFYKRTGSAAPTYTVTLTQIEGGTLKASTDGGFNYTTGPISAEENEEIRLLPDTDPFHEFDYESGWTTTPEDFAAEIISDGDVFHFNMPAYDVTIQASYIERPTHAIEVIHSEGGVTSVTYNGEDISAAPAGLPLTLSATPDADHVFSKWEIRNGEYLLTTLVEANTTFNMPEPGYYYDESAPITFQAIFSERPKYTVNISQSMENGTVTASPSECYSGTTVTLTANANSGYQYVYGNISVVDADGHTVTVNHTSNGGSFTMPGSDVTVSATFKKLYSVSMGTVQNGSAYAMPGSAVSGAIVSVFVTPNAGCAVFGVRADYDGGYVQASYEYTTGEGQDVYLFDMPAYDVTVNVDIRQTYTVSYTQSTGGAFSVSPTTNVMHSQRVDIVITGTETHYSFDDANYENKIIVKDASEETVIVNKDSYRHYYFSMPASDATVSVTFDEDPKNDITVNNPEGCTISVYPSSENVYAGTNVGLTCNLQEGYRFVEWVVKDGENPITVYDGWFTMPNSPNVTVTATLEVVEAHTVNIAEGITGGSVSAFTNTDHEAPINAYENEIVYLNNTPDPGYQFVSYTVTSECGTVEVYNNFYFYMPDCDVTVSAEFVLEPQDLTVNDGTVTNYDVLFNSYSTDNLTKSQFIIPSSDLVNMYDGTITNLTFYHDKSNFDFTGTWNVYIKEIDYTEIQNNDYFPTSADDLVYTGSLSFYNHTLTIALSESYQYNDGNLMICFEQTTQGNYLANTLWYGVSTQGNTSRGGYDYNNGAGWHGNYSFLPKTTFRYMPSANPQARYAITVNQPEVGGTISASKALAVEGTIITLSKSLEEGYVFNNWVVMQGETPITVENDQFEMPAGDVTVTAVLQTLPRYAITVTPNEHGTVRVNNAETPDENGYLEDALITLIAQGNEGWTLAENGYTITPSDPTVMVEIQPGAYGSYYFYMPACNVTISSTFRELEQYTVTYHINGVESQETVYEEQHFYPSQPTLPAGTEWYSWVTEDLEGTYTTTQPENRFYGGEISEDMDLYAVFKFTEIIPLEGESSWSQIYSESELEDGDRFILASSIYSYEDYNSHYYMMSQRDEEWGNHFTSTEGYPTYSSTSYRYEFTNLPSNVTILTAEKLEGSNWKIHFVDAYKGENTLANVYGTSLVPYDLWVGVDACETWNVEWGQLKSTLNDYQYVSLTNDLTFNIDSYNQAYIYKEVKPTQTNYYYMTSVLGIGEADVHITTDTEANNVVIANNAKLTIDNGATLDVAGICLSAKHDAAQLVVEDGAQLIVNNTGVLATMKKNITGSEWYTISSPLAANTEFADVTNLIPTTVVDTVYDLYRLDEKYGIWENARVNEGVAFTTIDKGLGYLYANATEIDHIAFAGEVNVAPAECTLTNSATNGFNLIGNPFTQNIKLANVTGVTLAKGFYVLTNQNTWDAKIETESIAPLQGFLVQVDGETGGTATIEKPAAPSSKGERSAEQVTNIEMIVSNSSYRDNAFAMFGEGTGLNKVNHRNAEAPMLYVPQDGEDFAIAFMNENTTVFPVSFKAMTTGKYSVSLKATDNISTLVLVDNMTGAETDMLLEDSYSFIGSPADSESRFTVKLGISHNDSQSDSEHFVYQNGSELVINGEGTLQIFDVLGRVVISEEVHGQTVNVGGLSTGAYIVRLTGEGVMTQKIVVR